MNADKLKAFRENRSFVIRQVRMSPHQKVAYERLAPRYCIPFDETWRTEDFDWNATFGRSGARRILDIGFGMGQELAELAEQNPGTDFVGVEVHKPGVGRLLGQLEARGITNVRIVRYDAVTVCNQMIPRNSLDGIHLFFPDPWPKKRHHKRRLVRPGFPELIAPLLTPGGYFYAVTDWEDYALAMLDVLNDTPLMLNANGDGFSPPQRWRPQTAFERKGLAKGHDIFELLYHRAQC
jgi:tRNA (guanine-N7-)-methyltransferase